MKSILALAAFSCMAYTTVFSRGTDSNHPNVFEESYACKKQGCLLKAPYVPWQDYWEDIHINFNTTNCHVCQEMCSMWPEFCGAVACGGTSRENCVFWNIGNCIDKNSPNFFEYTNTDFEEWGYTCYRTTSTATTRVTDSSSEASTSPTTVRPTTTESTTLTDIVSATQSSFTTHENITSHTPPPTFTTFTTEISSVLSVTNVDLIMNP